MASIRFRYITKDRDRHSNLRYYFRRPGRPKMRLRGLPGPEEFMAAYKATLSGNAETQSEKSFESHSGARLGRRPDRQEPRARGRAVGRLRPIQGRNGYSRFGSCRHFASSTQTRLEETLVGNGVR
jgi:hypothetical protein